jgi:hypothetical protein
MRAGKIIFIILGDVEHEFVEGLMRAPKFANESRLVLDLH